MASPAAVLCNILYMIIWTPYFAFSFLTGEKQFSFEEFLPIVKSILKIEDTGTYAEFCEAFKSFDREGMGFITAGEMNYMLSAMGMFFLHLRLQGYKTTSSPPWLQNHIYVSI